MARGRVCGGVDGPRAWSSRPRARRRHLHVREARAGKPGPEGAGPHTELQRPVPGAVPSTPWCPPHVRQGQVNTHPPPHHFPLWKQDRKALIPRLVCCAKLPSRELPNAEPGAVGGRAEGQRTVARAGRRGRLQEHRQRRQLWPPSFRPSAAHVGQLPNA